MITAHPDDEDGGMLTYESRGRVRGYALLTSNRGEGGANVMSADYWDALRLTRTHRNCWRPAAITASINSGRASAITVFRKHRTKRSRNGRATACSPMPYA